MKVLIKPLATNGFPVVEVPGELRQYLGTSGTVIVSFGLRRRWAAVWTGAPGSGIVGLSESLVDELVIPLPGSFRIVALPGRLRIGPVIGILAGRSREELTKRRLRLLANHLLEQGDGGGLFYVFDRTGVSCGRQLIHGYRLVDPHTETWAAGQFPLPDVIFRRYGVGLGATGKRLAVAGVKIFNQLFHKGQAARWLASCEMIAPHLPETSDLPASLERAMPVVLKMIRRYPAVFIKPRWGSRGAKVIRIQRSTDGYRVEQVGGDPIHCPDEGSLARALLAAWPRAAIIQQGVPVVTVGGRVIDFRVILQRDGTGHWQVTAIYGRIGGPHQFVTNVDPGGIPVPFAEAATYLFGQDPGERFCRREQLVQLALAVGEAMDGSGLLLADLGLDVSYDVTGHPWLIEVNNRDPNHNITWEAGSWSDFFHCRTRPLAFAVHVAGFPTDNWR